MTESSAQVVLGESLTPIGQLRFTQTGPRQFSTFSYDPAWIKDPRAFTLQPDMPFEGGPFHASAQPGNPRDALAGAFSDAAPDSWGRRLLERAYGKGLSEFEYLTLSDDTCRQGALRFLDDQGKVITGKSVEAVPRLLDLQAITAIARAYEQGKDISAEDMQALAGAGGSGGGRPKANVRDEHVLWLAKFTSIHDQHPIEQIEVATLTLANPAPDRNPHLETAIMEGGSHDRSIKLALDACEFFEIPEADARRTIRTAAQRISDGWRDAFRQVGVTGARVRDYEPAFINEQTDIGLAL